MSTRSAHLLVKALLLMLLAPNLAPAQQKRALLREDYSAWENPGLGLLSPDGQWLAHVIRRVNGNDELRVHDVPSGEVTLAPFGSGPVFSDDSRYLAFRVGLHEEERLEFQESGEPVRNGLGIFDTATGTTETVDGVAEFGFSEDGQYLAIHRYPGEREPSDEEQDTAPNGVDLIVRDLARGTEQRFANVSEFAWQDQGHLLAMITSTDGRLGNGVRFLDPSIGRLKVLDSLRSDYSGLAWRKDTDDLAVLRSMEHDAYEDDTHVILAWKGLMVPDASPNDFRLELDPTSHSSFPADTRIVRYRNPEWAEDGGSIYFGVKDWEKKPEAGAGDDEVVEEEEERAEKPADVEVWHSRDLRVIPEQKLRAKRDREKNYLSVWHLDSGRFIQLANETTENVWPLGGDRFALGLDLERARFEGMFGRARRDVDLIDLRTGERRRIIDQLSGGARFPAPNLMSGPEGRYLAYFKGDDYWIYDVAHDTHTNVTADLPGSFANREDDHPAPQTPPYGVAGWTENDGALLVYDRYDVWHIPTDGSQPARMTRGAEDEIRHRYVKLDPDEESIDTSRAMYFSLYAEWTKQSGFARLAPGDHAPERLVWRDRSLDQLQKASAADVFAYVEQDFDDSPDYFVGGPNLADRSQVTETNPFQADYHWGKSELIEYRNSQGDRLQGALFYPADYQPGRQYPMVVYVYEKRSQFVHRYAVPSERSTYNTSVFTTQGYFVLQPDVVFRFREPGASALDCITSGVERVLETGMIDRNRVGLVGHSWGGYETAFLVTQTDLSAAAVAGAPLTNFFSMYGSVFWNTGIPETGHFEVGQERMEVPFWEDVDAYVRNSPLFSIQNMNTPLLMEFGDKDGSVDWHQGIEMYNAARRLGKEMVLLVYPGENHSVRKKENQIDYHHRILDWFGHKLQGEKPAKWITEGVGHLEREEELKRASETEKKRAVPEP